MNIDQLVIALENYYHRYEGLRSMTDHDVTVECRKDGVDGNYRLEIRHAKGEEDTIASFRQGEYTPESEENFVSRCLQHEVLGRATLADVIGLVSCKPQIAKAVKLFEVADDGLDYGATNWAIIAGQMHGALLS